MGINLVKGQKVNVDANNTGNTKYVVGLGWDTNTTDTGGDFDLDTSAFLLNANAKIPSPEYFVFYNNLKSPDGSVEHTGDNLSGAGDGDDESIKVDLAKIDASIQEILFVVTIHDSAGKKNFGQVRNAFIRVYDEATKNEILKYELGEDFSIETGITFGKLYKRNNEWKFEAVGSGYQGGLQAFVDRYA